MGSIPHSFENPLHRRGKIGDWGEPANGLETLNGIGPPKVSIGQAWQQAGRQKITAHHRNVPRCGMQVIRQHKLIFTAAFVRAISAMHEPFESILMELSG